MHIFIWFYLETYYILLALCNQRIHFLFGERQRIAHLHTRRSIILEIGYFRTLGIQFFRSIKSDVSLTSIQQHLHVLLVYFTTLGLTVRTMFSAEADTFIKRNTQPLERLQYIFFRSRYKPVRISIFNTEN